MTNYRNRGRAFEELITHSCKVYRHKRQAVIHKIPNDWTVQRVGKRIISAFPTQKSTVDFLGITGSGRSIAIEAKTTAETTRFELRLLHAHQLDYLQLHAKMGGLSYVFMDFVKLRKVFRVPIEFLVPYVEAAADGGKKSIPIEEIALHCDEIKSCKGVPLHFLAGLL